MFPDEFQTVYGFKPAGMNFYMGINDTTTGAFNPNSQPDALNFSHHKFFTNLGNDTNVGETVRVMLGLEPPHWLTWDKTALESGCNDPFQFVLNHQDFVTALAKGLAQKQADFRSAGKTLEIVVRFASEMNTRRAGFEKFLNGKVSIKKVTQRNTLNLYNAWGHWPVEFRNTFRVVRGIFKAHAPLIKFAFSPAIRADLRRSYIRQVQPTIDPLQLSLFDLNNYWPGNDVVDYLSCTWYVQDPLSSPNAQRLYSHSMGFFEDYFRYYAPMTGKLLAIDELGCEKKILDMGRRDQVLSDMIALIRKLETQNFVFEHATLFLEGDHDQDKNTLRTLV